MATWAVARRQIVTCTRYPADFWASLASPFVSLVIAVGLARAFAGAAGIPEGFRANSGTTDYTGFLIFSILFWNFVESQLNLGFGLLTEMQRGTLEGVFLSPVPRGAYLLGMAVYNFLRTVVNSLATLLLAWLVFGIQAPRSWGWLAGLFALNLVAVYGYGLVLAGVVLMVRSGALTYAWSTVLPLLAGETFSVSVLPLPLRVLGGVIPLTYGLDALRWAASGARPAYPLGVDLAVTAAAAIVLPASGAWLFGRFEGGARRRGTLGQF